MIVYEIWLDFINTLYWVFLTAYRQLRYISESDVSSDNDNTDNPRSTSAISTKAMKPTRHLSFVNILVAHVTLCTYSIPSLVFTLMRSVDSSRNLVITMLQLPGVYKQTIFGDEVVLRSIDWLENFPWRQDNPNSCKDKYEIFLCVKDFTSEEISVKTSDGLVVVEGRHNEKKDDHGFISRHFVRKYRLPEGCKLGSVQSRLTPDGVLVISVPREFVMRQDTVIPVSHMGFKHKSKL